MKRSLYLAAIVLSAFCLGCTKENGGNGDTPVVGPTTHHVITEDKLAVEAEGLSLTMPATAIGDTVELAITKTTSSTPLIGCDENSVVYDISMGDVHDIDGVIEIKIPFKASGDNQVGAGYFNEESQEWEPVDWEYKDGNVIITTDHLSEYGVFNIKYENTASANFIAICEEYNNLFGGDDLAAIQAFVALSQSDGAASQLLDALGDAYGTTNQFMNDLGYNSVKALGFDTAADGFMNKYGNNFSYLGVLFTTWQVARQVHQGKNKEAFASIIDAATTNMISIGGSLFGASFGVVGLVAYLASKYIVNSFFQGVITSRQDIWTRAYELYLKKGNPRTYAEWYKFIYPIVTDEYKTDWEKEEAIDKLVNDYCYAFWNDETARQEYYYEITGQTSGAGLNDDSSTSKQIQREISENRRGQLYQNTIPEVINEINGKLQEKNFKTYKSQLLKYQKMLNQPLTINFIDGDVKNGKSELAGYKVKFANLPKEITDPEKWECTIDDSGRGSIKLTVFAYIKNKMQPKMVLVDKDDKEVKEVIFTPCPPETTVTLSGKVSDILLGQWVYFEYFDSEPEQYLGRRTDTEVITLKFNSDGTYTQATYHGLRDAACKNLKYTSWDYELKNQGTYIFNENDSTITMKSNMPGARYTWSDYADQEYKLKIEETDKYVPDYGNGEHPNYKGVKMMPYRMSGRKTQILYKEPWIMDQVPIDLKIHMNIGIGCRGTIHSRTVVEGDETEEDRECSSSWVFKADSVSVSQTGSKVVITGSDRTHEYNSSSDRTIDKSIQMTMELEHRTGGDGKDEFYLKNISVDHKIYDKQWFGEKTEYHKWSTGNLSMDMDEFAGYGRLQFKANNKNGGSVSYSYGFDYISNEQKTSTCSGSLVTGPSYEASVSI